MPDIKERIELFVTKAQEMIDKHYQDNNYLCGSATFHAEYLSEKWCRIVKKDSSTSVYAFVCLKDGATKTLGTLKAGDVHKPAGWSAPAKHARANVFENDFAKCIGPYGVSYLR